MKSRLFATFLVLLTAATLEGATFTLTLPVAANTPGAKGSIWKTELILHNAGREVIPVSLAFHNGNGLVASTERSVAPRQRLSLDDVVGVELGSSGLGAVEVSADQRFAGKLAVHSRNYNLAARGTLGHDVPALASSSRLIQGETGVLAAPSDHIQSRFNFGIYAVDASTVRWSVVRADGTLAASLEVGYDAGTHRQYSRGIETLLQTDYRDGDTIHAKVEKGSLFVYGTAIDEETGDPTYVPGFRARENLPVELLGVDLDDNGTIDLADADGDGTVDAPVGLATAKFGNSFRVVVRDPEGNRVVFSLTEANRDILLTDENGKVAWNPSSGLAGTSGLLRLRVSDGVDESIVTIPVIFR